MTKTYYNLLITYICLFFSLISHAQTKNEKEERINKEDFPNNALEVTDHIPAHAKRLRFYKETDGEKQSFEAKFKLNKLRYSVEFNTNGELEEYLNSNISKKASEIGREQNSQLVGHPNDNYAKKVLMVYK